MKLQSQTQKARIERLRVAREARFEAERDVAAAEAKLYVARQQLQRALSIETAAVGEVLTPPKHKVYET